MQNHGHQTREHFQIHSTVYVHRIHLLVFSLHLCLFNLLRLQLMDQLEACAHLEVTVLRLQPPRSPAPLALSATALDSAHKMSVLAVRRGNLILFCFAVWLLRYQLTGQCKSYAFTLWVIMPLFLHVSFYCLGSNNTSPSGPCFPGFYCMGGSSSPVQNEAEEGFYSLAGAARSEPCPLGTFQPVGSHPHRILSPSKLKVC